MDGYLKYLAPVTAIVFLTTFWIWETAAPFFIEKNRVKHGGRNLTIAIVNAAFLGIIFSTIIVLVSSYSTKNKIGLLYFLNLPLLLHGIIAFIILDFWRYWWHLFNHKIYFLWRFHRMHHSDPNVDVTTATRFHIGELIFSEILNIGLILIFGIQVWVLIIYNAALLAVTMFHHSNIALPNKVDNFIRYFIVTPFMHKVHHSKIQRETDSNYASVFSIWDRIFKSYNEKENYKEIDFGLEDFDDEKKQTILGLLKTPFFRNKRAS